MHGHKETQEGQFNCYTIKFLLYLVKQRVSFTGHLYNNWSSALTSNSLVCVQCLLSILSLNITETKRAYTIILLTPGLHRKDISVFCRGAEGYYH